MKRFARLFAELDGTTRTNAKVAAMEAYFSTADPADAAWAVHFLSGNRPKRLIPVRRLAGWAMQAADVPEWLFEECYHAVGDLAETIALLLPVPAGRSDHPLHRWVEERLLPLAGEDEETQRAVVLDAWSTLGDTERFVWNKLITGSFRVGVSQKLVVRALARIGEVDEPTVAHRLMGSWEPSPRSFPETLPPIVYRSEDIVRKVYGGGQIQFMGRHVTVGKALLGQRIALRPTPEDGCYDVVFCNQITRTINLRAI